MKVQTTYAQAWWIVLADEIRPDRGVDLTKIGAGLQDLFHFPGAATEIKDGGGAEFVNGRLGEGADQINIVRLAIFNDGLNVHVPTNTDDAETALQSALGLLFSLGVRRPTTRPMHFYQSVVVVDFEHSLDVLLPAPLLKRMSEMFSFQGQSQFMSLTSNVDPASIADGRVRGLNPSLFKIERRSDVPYETNRYFSLANMKTADHIEILSEFEAIARKMKG